MAIIDWSAGVPRVLNEGVFQGEDGRYYILDGSGGGWEPATPQEVYDFRPGDYGPDAPVNTGRNSAFRNANWRELRDAGLWSNLGDPNAPLWQRTGYSGMVSDPNRFASALLSLGGFKDYGADLMEGLRAAGPLSQEQLGQIQGTITAGQQNAADTDFGDRLTNMINPLTLGALLFPAVGAFGAGAAGAASAAGSAAAEGAGASLADIAAGSAAAGATGGGMDWLNSIPDDLGYDFVPGESLTNNFSGIPNDTGWDFGPDMGNAPITSNPSLAPSFWNTIKQYGSTAVSAVQKLLKDGGSQSDLLNLLGKIAPAALGAFASNRQADAYSDLADKYMGIGAPSRARYEASFAPGFSMEADPGYKAALDQAAKATLHGLSVTGNPADSPNAWARSLSDLYEKTAYPALQSYRSMNANAGGLSRFAEAAPSVSTSAIGAQRGIYDAIGAGAADIFSPPKSLSDLLREIKRAGY